ncbi:helix-turn-helix domain-containing protein [Tianweitania sp.]|uniref:helix-turn-helix domain-containing protein n=1 Tax=Tianweitania sp. TaxID=2021634 RepID=UPI002896DFD7|nr:helix-turn-helix domain-containing protein [Tianweitania sp.]
MSYDRDVFPYAPLGLSRDEAARYVGVDVPLFMQLVSAGRMPLPKRLGDRDIWSRIELEAAFIRLPEGVTDQTSRTLGQGSSNGMAEKDRPHVYSPAKLAERWGCSVGHVHKLIESGQVTAFRVGKLVRVLTENVEKFEDWRRKQMP